MTKSLSAIRSAAVSFPKALSGRPIPPCRPPPMAAQQEAGKVVCGGNAWMIVISGELQVYPVGYSRLRGPASRRTCCSSRRASPLPTKRPRGTPPGEKVVRRHGVVIDRGVAVRLRDHHVVPRKPQGKRVVNGMVPSQVDLLVGHLDREHDGNLAFGNARIQVKTRLFDKFPDRFDKGAVSQGKGSPVGGNVHLPSSGEHVVAEGPKRRRAVPGREGSTAGDDVERPGGDVRGPPGPTVGEGSLPPGEPLGTPKPPA